MNIALACDHRGFHCKTRVVALMKSLGHEVKDFGSHDDCVCDYPDFAAPAARCVARGDAAFAVLLDGIGTGMSIVANKVAGVRAFVATDELTARLAREHNGVNVLCIGTDLVSSEAINKIIEAFLNTGFAEGRHERRVKKITEIEQKFFDRD